jgi:heme/copper-type cytochrome/quinol oxidase subunit 1
VEQLTHITAHRERIRSLTARVDAPVTAADQRRQVGRVVVKWLTTTDHKLLGQLYLITSFGFFLFGGLITISGFCTPGGAADFGWFAYAPLSNAVRSPGVGGDLWIMGLWDGRSGHHPRCGQLRDDDHLPSGAGDDDVRMPIFTWNILVTSILVLIAFPILAGALLMLEADRALGTHVFDAATGGPLLWQHLFWFFGHPEVYIIALPFFGIITEIPTVFSRKPVFGYIGLVGATLAIAALSATVWAHHMFATGAVNLPLFSFHDLHDRGTHGREVLQLDRHDVGRVDLVRYADVAVGRVP